MLSFSEGEVTRLRREFKRVLEEQAAQVLSQRLSEDMGGLTPTPTRIVSVYFDRPGCPLAERALRSPDDCLKVRTKEYAPDVGAEGVERVVLEVKRERHGLTQKRRVWVPRAELGRVLGGGTRLLPLIAGGSLSPVLAVTYQRHVYPSPRGWRVTVDRDIGYHEIAPEMAMSQFALTSERLGPPRSREGRVVVEVKHLGQELPDWLASLNPGGAQTYSKFAEGMARVHAFVVDGVARG